MWNISGGACVVGTVVGSYCCFGVWRCTSFVVVRLDPIVAVELWRCTCFGCFLFLLLFALDCFWIVFGLLLVSSTPVLVDTSR